MEKQERPRAKEKRIFLPKTTLVAEVAVKTPTQNWRGRGARPWRTEWGDEEVE